MTTPAEALEGVTRRVTEHFGRAVTPETRFREDLEADSLDLLALLVELEDAFALCITDDEVTGIETVGDAALFVSQHAGRDGAASALPESPDTGPEG